MAKNAALILAMLLVVLATAPTTRSHSSNLITKEITAYGEMILQGPNTNVVPVAGAPNQPRNFTTFGTVYVLNISLRKDVSSDSLPFAQTQGVLAISAKDGKQVYISVSIVFTFGEYQGSSLSFQGTVGTVNSMLGGELAVTGGTKSHRFARGYALLRTIIPVVGTNNTINEIKIFLKYYN